MAVPILGFLLYLFFQSPVALVTVAATVGALMLPVQSGVTLWLQRTHMDSRVRPGAVASITLWCVFFFQCTMALAVIRFVVF